MFLKNKTNIKIITFILNLRPKPAIKIRYTAANNIPDIRPEEKVKVAKDRNTKSEVFRYFVIEVPEGPALSTESRQFLKCLNFF